MLCWVTSEFQESAGLNLHSGEITNSFLWGLDKNQTLELQITPIPQLQASFVLNL